MSTDNPFKVGDVVVLKSGGPKMTVNAIGSNEIHCLWFDEKTGEIRKNNFYHPVLMKYVIPEIVV